MKKWLFALILVASGLAQASGKADMVNKLGEAFKGIQEKMVKAAEASSPNAVAERLRKTGFDDSFIKESVGSKAFRSAVSGKIHERDLIKAFTDQPNTDGAAQVRAFYISKLIDLPPTHVFKLAKGLLTKSIEESIKVVERNSYLYGDKFLSVLNHNLSENLMRISDEIEATSRINSNPQIFNTDDLFSVLLSSYQRVLNDFIEGRIASHQIKITNRIDFSNALFVMQIEESVEASIHNALKSATGIAPEDLVPNLIFRNDFRYTVFTANLTDRYAATPAKKRVLNALGVEYYDAFSELHPAKWNKEDLRTAFALISEIKKFRTLSSSAQEVENNLVRAFRTHLVNCSETPTKCSHKLVEENAFLKAAAELAEENAEFAKWIDKNILSDVL